MCAAEDVWKRKFENDEKILLGITSTPELQTVIQNVFQPSVQIVPLRLSEIRSFLPFADWDGLLQSFLLVLEVLAAGIRYVEAGAIAIPNPAAELT